MRKSATTQSENCFTAFLSGQAPGTILEPLTFYSAQNGLFTGSGFTWTVAGTEPPQRLTLVLPNAIVQAQSPIQEGYDSGIYNLRLTVGVMTQIDDASGQPAGIDIHRQRVEVVRDLVETFTAATSPMNWTTGETDPRVVQNICVSCIVYDGEVESETDRHLVTEIAYQITVGIS